MSKVFIDRENKEEVHKNKTTDEKYVRLPDNYINIINPVLGHRSKCWGALSLKNCSEV